jgi:type III pantothenate kinase
MKVDLVVDIGNTRLKWGHCQGGKVVAMASLPPNDEAAWLAQRARWNLDGMAAWAVAGVNPEVCAQFGRWLRNLGQQVTAVERAAELPLRVALKEPDHVGIDRLLGAVAARSRTEAGTPAVIVDAGSAVTVDLVDESGAFRGGAIFPGLRLMSQALHDYTALLPLVALKKIPAAVPGASTEEAVQVGLFWAAAGGIRALIDQLSQRVTKGPALFLGGGDARLLSSALPGHTLLWPEMTLEGLRLTVEALS